MAKPLPRLTRRQVALVGAGAVAGASGVLGWQALSGGPDQRDVRAFGARGDGRHDDAAALQRAIDSGEAELWFPAGHYRLTRPLRPRSGQSWLGVGARQSVLVHGGDPDQPPFNLVHGESSDALENVSITGLGFLGGRGLQLRSSRSGQEGFAIYLRRPLSNITLRDCRFEHGGDGRDGGGGVVLGPKPDQSGCGLVRIRVEGCVFADNGNVPGLYVSSSADPRSECGGIVIRDNSFSGTVGSTKVQNSVYVLGGGPGGTLRHVDVSHNRFDFSTAVDAAIELNWVEGFVIAGNTMHFQAAMPGASGILLRDGSFDGVVGGNVITSATAEASLRGVVILNFRHPGRIGNVVVSGNVLSGVAGAISADRGASGVTIADNRISGRDAEGSFGIRIVDSSAIRVSGNTITAMNRAITVGHGDTPHSDLRDVLIERNRFRHCGGAGVAQISAIAPPSGLRMAGLVIRDNDSADAVADSPPLDPLLLEKPEIP